MKVEKTLQTKFGMAINFKKQVSNPKQIGTEINHLIDKFKNFGINHKNLAVSRVVDKNSLRKTMTIELSIIIEPNDRINDFLKKYPKYYLKSDLTIEAGYKISISNNMEAFKSAIDLLVSRINEDYQDANSMDLSQNPIIEVTKVAYDGSVLGFDLYLEI